MEGGGRKGPLKKIGDDQPLQEDWEKRQPFSSLQTNNGKKGRERETQSKEKGDHRITESGEKNGRSTKRRKDRPDHPYKNSGAKKRNMRKKNKKKRKRQASVSFFLRAGRGVFSIWGKKRFLVRCRE